MHTTNIHTYTVHIYIYILQLQEHVPWNQRLPESFIDILPVLTITTACFGAFQYLRDVHHRANGQGNHL